MVLFSGDMDMVDLEYNRAYFDGVRGELEGRGGHSALGKRL